MSASNPASFHNMKPNSAKSKYHAAAAIQRFNIVFFIYLFIRLSVETNERNNKEKGTCSSSRQSSRSLPWPNPVGP